MYSLMYSCDNQGFMALLQSEESKCKIKLASSCRNSWRKVHSSTFIGLVDTFLQNNIYKQLWAMGSKPNSITSHTLSVTGTDLTETTITNIITVRENDSEM